MDLTICITCFNEGKLLNECWESVVMQTDDRWTAIMLLDGGADVLTEAIFDEIKHPKLKKYKNLKNLGPYLNRNKAFSLTETKYHYYVDGDDLLKKNAVETFYNVYKINPNYDIYYTDILSFTDDKKFTYIKSADKITSKELVEGFALYGANIIKRDTWVNIGGYEEQFNWTLGDLDFYISAIEKGANFCHIPEALYLYRRRNDSITNTFKLKYHEIYEQIIEKHPLFFADQTSKSRLLSLGFLTSAKAYFAECDFNIAENFALKAKALGRKEANKILWKIKRDKHWPLKWLLIRRKATIYFHDFIKEFRTSESNNYMHR